MSCKVRQFDFNIKIIDWFYQFQPHVCFALFSVVSQHFRCSLSRPPMRGLVARATLLGDKGWLAWWQALATTLSKASHQASF